MRKQFVVPVLREEATLARLTLGRFVIILSSDCGIQCTDGIIGGPPG